MSDFFMVFAATASHASTKQTLDKKASYRELEISKKPGTALENSLFNALASAAYLLMGFMAIRKCFIITVYHGDLCSIGMRRRGLR